MKKDPNGNEVYLGYTLVKPSQRGGFWTIITPGGTTQTGDLLTSRDAARTYVKDILDNESHIDAPAEMIVGHFDGDKDDSRDRIEKLLAKTEFKGPMKAKKIKGIRATPISPKHDCDRDDVTFRFKGYYASGEVTSNGEAVRIHRAPHAPSFVGKLFTSPTAEEMVHVTLAEIAIDEKRRRKLRKQEKKSRLKARPNRGRVRR